MEVFDQEVGRRGLIIGYKLPTIGEYTSVEFIIYWYWIYSAKNGFCTKMFVEDVELFDQEEEAGLNYWRDRD